MQMEPLEQWIWLSEKEYPEYQTTVLNTFVGSKSSDDFVVVNVRKEYRFEQPIVSAELRFSGDTFFVLECNGTYLANGPATAGGDFLDNNRPRPQYYATEMIVGRNNFPGLNEGRLDFSALVRMKPVRMCEYSRGHGGFFLTAHVTFADGTKTVLLTDKSWTIQRLGAYTASNRFDGRIADSEPMAAAPVNNVWHCLTAPIPPCAEVEIFPEDGGELIVPAGEEREAVLLFDKIYAGYLFMRAESEGELTVDAGCFETDCGNTNKTMIFVGKQQYRSTILESVGGVLIRVKNHGAGDGRLTVSLRASCYPVTDQARTVTSDEELNLVLDVCAHTLRYCRQTHHLDSPSHCEPLACTGDYYIASLMTAFTFGDQRLAAFDVRRTAQLLRYHDGRMFHTTYSLIWVQMLWDVYRLTGERALLTDCEDALILLLERFSTYLGDNGLIETPPDYMFIDWLVPDGISTHHPPKALGQTCLNLFYFGALNTAAEIWRELGEKEMAYKQIELAERLKEAILTNLFDRERGLFFEGLNTPTPEHMLYHYLPQNVEKRYFRKHANILAAYFGIVDREECCRLLDCVMEDESLGLVQPYFMHYLLEAVYRNGLREKYTLRILEEWKEPVRECSKGLAEGFHKPEPGYRFDHSHAWGGTPAWSLPLALTGMEILEVGCRKLRFSPNMLGLTSAFVQIPTPLGMVELDMKRGEPVKITAPEGIEIV